MSEAARKEVAVHTGGQVIQANASSLMEVISRAAADPNTDVDKLERLLGMYERITAQNAKAAYTAALAQLQPKLPVISERGKTDKTTYATWEDINDAIRPLLHEFGFALNFRVGRSDSAVSVTGVLSHEAGHSEETTLELPVDSSGSKNAVQAVGSSVSYGKRYTAIALLNITSRAKNDRDDDGRNADPNFWITEDQVGELVALMDEVGADRQRFLNHLRIDTLSHLPRRRFAEAVKALEAKRRAQ